MVSKITRQQVLNLYSGLRAVSSLKGAQFSYAIVKNFRKLSPVVSSFKFSDEQKAFEEKRNAILAEKPTPDGDQGKRIEALEKEYEATLKQTQAYLDEEVEVDLHKIPLVRVPEDIDASLLEPILPIILEELDK